MIKLEHVVSGLAICAVIVITLLIAKEARKPYKDAEGKPNKALIGNEFGSVGRGDTRWSKMNVREIKPGGFVTLSFGRDNSGGYTGAINPIDGVPDLAVGDWVRVEKRMYVDSERASPEEIWIITKRLAEKEAGK